jgi:hypothetical protein
LAASPEIGRYGTTEAAGAHSCTWSLILQCRSEDTVTARRDQKSGLRDSQAWPDTCAQPERAAPERSTPASIASGRADDPSGIAGDIRHVITRPNHATTKASRATDRHHWRDPGQVGCSSGSSGSSRGKTRLVKRASRGPSRAQAVKPMSKVASAAVGYFALRSSIARGSPAPARLMAKSCNPGLWPTSITDSTWSLTARTRPSSSSASAP